MKLCFLFITLHYIHTRTPYAHTYTIRVYVRTCMYVLTRYASSIFNERDSECAILLYINNAVQNASVIADKAKLTCKKPNYDVKLSLRSHLRKDLTWRGWCR